MEGCQYFLLVVSQPQSEIPVLEARDIANSKSFGLCENKIH
jgi:hypothetical protein